MSPRALAIALFASVALNLFVIGTVVGGLVIAHRLHAVGGPLARPGAAQLPLWAAADGLPPEHRQAYRALLRDQAMGVGRQVHEARMARRRAWEELNAEPFDAAGAAKHLSEARALEMQARGEVEQRIVQFAATLPQAERAELAAGLARSAPNPAMRRMRAGPPEGPPRP
jgi:uncharacterized membrane protein